MILRDWLEAVDYRITEGSEYYWRCYGPDAYQLTVALDDDRDRNDRDRYASCVFDRKTLRVIEATVTDDDRNYRWIQISHRDAHDDEARSRGFDPNIAYDAVRFIDLELGQDILEKTRAILRGESYDDRVQVEIDLTPAEQFRLMQLAHERDMTLNQFVEQLIQEVIDRETPLVNKEPPADDWEFA